MIPPKMILNSRRDFIKNSSIASLGFLISQSCRQEHKSKPTILIVSGWQDVNIGDIAHTPGLLHILETFIPEANIILWKKSKSSKVEFLISKNFPKVKIIHGEVDEFYDVDNQEVLDAFKKSDLMIHGSGPFIVGKSNLKAWNKYSSKPFGIFGTTIQDIDDDLHELLKKASFIFTRETKSLEVLKQRGLSGDYIGFAPDATFYLNIKNDLLAQSFLQQNELKENEFICAIPRLRYTPYHKFRKVDWSDQRIEMVESTNEKYKEIDHAKLREAIVAWVRETGKKVLICPEMTYQVDIMDELLIDPLPKDVRPFVVKRGYWMPDEAASVYRSAFAVLSFDCHSPIIALANGTPAFYLRQPEDTIKGQMYYDLGLEDWVFEIDETTGGQITDELRKVWQNYSRSKEVVQKSIENVNQIYQKNCLLINNVRSQKSEVRRPK